MPRLKTCRVCGKPCSGDQCESHPAKKVERELTTTERGYGWDWQQFRVRYLNANPFCVDCREEGRVRSACEVHHIDKIKDAPEKRLDFDNVLSLCKQCHDNRSARGE